MVRGAGLMGSVLRGVGRWFMVMRLCVYGVGFMVVGLWWGVYGKGFMGRVTGEWVWGMGYGGGGMGYRVWGIGYLCIGYWVLSIGVEGRVKGPTGHTETGTQTEIPGRRGHNINNRTLGHSHHHNHKHTFLIIIMHTITSFSSYCSSYFS